VGSAEIEVVLKELVAVFKKNSDKISEISELSAVFLKSKDHKEASSLSSCQYREFVSGEFSLPTEMYDDMESEEIEYGSVFDKLNIFYEEIRANYESGNWKEDDFCQPPTDKLLKSICPLFFESNTVSCLRDYYLYLDSADFTFTASGSLDHVVVVGGDPDNAEVDGLPLVYVESKNLDWTFSGGTTPLWRPKAQALVYLAALSDIVALKLNGVPQNILYILLQNGFQWILLRRTYISEGPYAGRYVQAATQPVNISDSNGRKVVTCWLMICFRQGMALKADGSGGMSYRDMSSLSLQDNNKSQRGGGKKHSGSRRGRGGPKGSEKSSTQRVFGNNSSNRKCDDMCRQTSQNSANKPKFLPLTEKSLNRGWRGVVKHVWERRGESIHS
jgi:hypothetical protein